MPASLMMLRPAPCSGKLHKVAGTMSIHRRLVWSAAPRISTIADLHGLRSTKNKTTRNTTTPAVLTAAEATAGVSITAAAMGTTATEVAVF